MSIESAVTIGVTSNELSKQLTGSSETTPTRTIVAVGTGAAAGAVVSGSLVIASVAAAPVTMSLAVASGICAGIASLFDD
jgi:hypothetical protein